MWLRPAGLRRESGDRGSLADSVVPSSELDDLGKLSGVCFWPARACWMLHASIFWVFVWKELSVASKHKLSDCPVCSSPFRFVEESARRGFSVVSELQAGTLCGFFHLYIVYIPIFLTWIYFACIDYSNQPHSHTFRHYSAKHRQMWDATDQNSNERCF